MTFYFRTYKIEYRPTIWKCFFECYHDDNCDFFVDVHGYCCYGDFQYTGNPATTWTDQVTIYVKNGKYRIKILKIIRTVGPKKVLSGKSSDIFFFNFRKSTRYFFYH